MSKIKPGWYRDPAEPTTQRYWDGEQWIGKPVDIDATPPAEPEPEPEPAPVLAVSDDRLPPAPPPQFGASVNTPLPVDKILAGRELANPGARLIARLIDTLAVLGLNAIVNGYFVYEYLSVVMPVVRNTLADPTRDPMDLKLPDRAYDLQLLITIIAILLWFAYEVPSTVNSGQTLGKKAMGIKVSPILGDKLRYGHVISRWSLLMMPMICFPVGLIMTFIDAIWCVTDRPFKQCLHDKSAGTLVILATTDKTTARSEGD